MTMINIEENNRLYRAINLNDSKRLILAKSKLSAASIAIAGNFVEDFLSLTLIDITEEYANKERIEMGLDFQKLKEGFFYQEIKNRNSIWHTHL